MNKQNNILVIKLSAFGDFIQSLGAMRAIKQHHVHDNITLLTTKPFHDIAKNSGYFDEIIIDKRPKFLQIKLWLDLAKTLNSKKIYRVYDLQNNDRTSIYFKLFLKKPEWVGIVKGASHRNTSPTRNQDLAFYGLKQDLELAGLHGVGIDDLKWMSSDISKFNISRPFILIACGCSPNKPEKKWSAENYILLCDHLIDMGYQPVLLGTSHEKQTANYIKEQCPSALNLISQTDFNDLASLGRKAIMAIGNDTGPMHFMGPTGCKTLVLFSGKSNPKHHRPLGNNVHFIQKDNINDIQIQEVMDKVKSIL